MTKNRIWLVVALFSCSLFAGAVDEGPAIILGGLTPDEGWIRVNARPYRISSSVESLCRSPLPADFERARTENPHASAYVTVFVNEIGAASMNAPSPGFPEGSMIVKQKYHSDAPPERTDAADLYTVMIKRKSGYNPSVGDWEFAVVAGDGRRVESRGRISTCMGCHDDHAATDYVYRTYRELESLEAEAE
jgi:hypothetical protein